MDENIFIIKNLVDKIQFRIKIQRILDSSMMLFWLYGIIGFVFMLVFFFVGWRGSVLVIQLVLVLYSFLIFGLVFFRIYFADLSSESAMRIDESCGLKDRVLTAIGILQDGQQISQMAQMQLEDTAIYTTKIVPRQVFRLRFPASTVAALLVILLYSLFFVLSICFDIQDKMSLYLGNTLNSNSSIWQPSNRTATSTNLADNRNKNNNTNPHSQIEQSVQKIINNLKKELTDLSKRQSQNNSANSASIADRAQRQLDRAASAEELVLALSETEAAIRADLDGLDSEVYDESFRDMAKAFDNADLLQQTAASIKKENYSQAATNLESVTPKDFAKMSAIERRTIDAELNQAADNMNRRNQLELELASRKFAKEIGRERNNIASDGDEFVDIKKNSHEIAQMLNSQQTRKTTQLHLTQQLKLIEQHKSQAINTYNKELAQNKKPEKNEPPEYNPNNSNNNTGNYNNNLGDEISTNDNQTENNNSQQIQKDEPDIIVRKGGSGNSQNGRLITMTPAQENNTTKKFEYKNLYLDYRKQMEAILDSEPVPAGQQKIIRRYFDSIKPDNSQESN
ncbi:MAG: hypothetical protein LBQ66_11795 [Planctomycetaceae bacterium]|nr:hypothetical protein [Planctomycetaceae bacterium]